MMLMGGCALQWRGRRQVLAVLLTACAGLGLILTYNRACWAAAGIGAMLLVMRWAWAPRSNSRHRWASISAIALVVVIGCGTVLSSQSMRHQVRAAAKEVSTMWSGDPDVGSRFDSRLGRRVLWWNAGWHLMWEAPLTGHGAGSTQLSLGRIERTLPPEWGAVVPGFITWNPHSPYVSTAIEQGLPGVALLLSALVGATTVGWKRGRGDPLRMGIGPAWITVLLIGTSHALLLDLYTATLVSGLLTLSVLPPLHRLHRPDGSRMPLCHNDLHDSGRSAAM